MSQETSWITDVSRSLFTTVKNDMDVLSFALQPFLALDQRPKQTLRVASVLELEHKKMLFNVFMYTEYIH